MNWEKTTLPSLRNIEWRTVKTDTNKINQVLSNVSTNNITELNQLIHAKGKFTNKWGMITRKHTKNRMQEKPNNFGLKYGNQENITKKPNG